MAIEKFGLDPDGKLGLSEDDVVMFGSNNFTLERMTKIISLIEAIQPWSQRNSNNKGSEYALFTEQGLGCEVLRTSGGGWQKGRFRFCLEFIPDDPESFMGTTSQKPSSPLDDLRTNLDI